MFCLPCDEFSVLNQRQLFTFMANSHKRGQLPSGFDIFFREFPSYLRHTFHDMGDIFDFVSLWRIFLMDSDYLVFRREKNYNILGKLSRLPQ